MGVGLAHIAFEIVTGLLRALAFLLTLLVIRYLLDISNPVRDIVMVRELVLYAREAFNVPTSLSDVNIDRLEHMRELFMSGFYAQDTVQDTIVDTNPAQESTGTEQTNDGK